MHFSRKALHFTALCSIISFFSSCTFNKTTSSGQYVEDIETVYTELYDSTRTRTIPIYYSYSVAENAPKNKGIAIFSHGYGTNKGDSYLGYSYLTEALTSAGYFTISIQQEVSTDSIMDLTGNPYQNRMAFWELGAANINFVLESFKLSHPELNFKTVVLLGHSHGGDIAAVFPTKYPNVATHIVTLDNLRAKLPRSSNLHVCSVRSSNEPPSVDVIPTEAEQRRYNISIIRMEDMPHNDMANNGTELQLHQIRTHVLAFLKERSSVL